MRLRLEVDYQPHHSKMKNLKMREFYRRIRRCPSASSVPGSLPVLFFRDIFAATFATVGLNPSYREYCDSAGRELTGSKRRFETLASLGAHNRRSLTQEQCDQAIERMRGYFGPDRPVYQWFGSLSRVVCGMGMSYQKGEAVHLDLVQEATDPTWSQLKKTLPQEHESLLAADLPFLQWQLTSFPFKAVVCSGRTAYERTRELLGSSTCKTYVLCHVNRTGKTPRVTCWVGIARRGGCKIGVVGWDKTLAYAGLDVEGQIELGRILRREIEALGVAIP